MPKLSKRIRKIVRKATPPLAPANPGSPEAVAAGCSCPGDDNEHGAGAYIVDGKPVYYMSSGCPIHGPLLRLHRIGIPVLIKIK